MNTRALTASTVRTMSSVELVALINKVRKEDNPEYTILEHSDFLKKVVKVLDVSAGNFSGTYKDSQNKERPCYNLPKRECHLMVMSESYKIQAAVYDRMTELEEQAAKPSFTLPDFTDPAEAAIAWAAEFKAKQAALAQIEADKPKVEFAMAVRNLDGSCLVREFAKVIGTGQNRLYNDLREAGYLMANNQPYQKHIDNGLFVVVEGTPFTDSKGKAHPTFTTRITGKGQVVLEKRFRKASKQGLVLLSGGAA
jgi:anti-repressor protein